MKSLLFAASALALAACAAVQADPTATTCQADQSRLTTATLALNLAQAQIPLLQAVGVSASALADAQKAVTAAQAEVTLAQSAVGANCASPAPQVAVSTPLLSAAVKLGG
jgi:hypothetical protein